MAHVAARFRPFWTHNGGVLAALGAAVMLSACAQTGDLVPGPLASLGGDETQTSASNDPMAELRTATEYWGKQYTAKPSDKTAALSYAKNLKAMGDKRQALAVLQEASMLHSRDPEVASEFGRLALEFDQLTIASRALEVADQPGAPDWRVISARGTLLAKQGQHKAAIPYFQRALAIAPNQPSVMNNLAIATAMSGDAQKAEELLRTASSTENAPTKVNQNLALVLGLQGKYEEAKSAGAQAAPASIAEANTDYVRRMVRLPAQDAPVPLAVANTTTAPGPAMRETTVETTSTGEWATNVASTAPASQIGGSNR